MASPTGSTPHRAIGDIESELQTVQAQQQTLMAKKSSKFLIIRFLTYFND